MRITEFKNHLLSLVQNKDMGDIDVDIYRTVNVTYSWTVDGGSSLSSDIDIPSSTMYMVDLETESELTHSVNSTYTSETIDEHGDAGCYTFSGWEY